MKKNINEIRYQIQIDNYNHITQYNDNINSHINVNSYYLSNETNPRFVVITVLELQAKINILDKKIENIKQIYIYRN